MPTTVKFVNANKSLFFPTVRSRVDRYFQEAGISRHANSAMWVKTIFFLGGYLLIYSLIISNQFGLWAMLGMASALGMFAAFIGFNISHDALHGAFSSRPWLNTLMGNTFCLLGASPYVWKITHNIVHHTYTNIPGHDEDIEVAPGLIRLDEQDRHHPWHRFQQWYAFPLYGLASLSWVFRKDYIKFYRKQIGQHETASHPKREHVKLFAFKAAYYFFFLALPMLVLDASWWQILIGFTVMHLLEGLTLGLVFQLAHVVEGTAFPIPGEANDIQNTWAIHQLQTTANFAPRSGLAAFFFGGLNRQIEHHLFPKVCHIHYPALTAIIQHTAQEFDLPYLENQSFGSALVSHFRILEEMGKKPGRTAASSKDSRSVEQYA